MFRQVQQQKLLQRLSPQQIQLIRLLEVPAVEMTERILQELDENPALELGEDWDSDALEPTGSDEGSNEDFTLGDYASEDDIPDYKLQQMQPATPEERRERVAANSTTSLHDYVLEQLGLLDLKDSDRSIAEYLVGNLDADGYLRRDRMSIEDDLSIHYGIEVDSNHLKRLMTLIQTLDPPGVGAFDLRDCLLIQLKRKSPTERIERTIVMLQSYFEEFSKKHYEQIQKKMDCSAEELKELIREVVKLNPKPGSMFGSALEQNMDQIVPDFTLENSDGQLLLSLNSASTPELHVSRSYKEMLHDYQAHEANQTREAKEALMFAKEKVEAAKWFIDAVRQRQETLMRTMQAIVDRQYEFFCSGDEKQLKPMILKDVAEVTGYDISTISRVSNSKYIQTDFGVFPVKYFFTEAMMTQQGDEVSTLEVKQYLQQHIDAEDKQNPLTDEQLSEILSEKGYVIARRTIAKYREQMGIPVARMRRNL
ncbi:MAG: RNA polymerase factor sigma-54 [Bacteroidales bacterium]